MSKFIENLTQVFKPRPRPMGFSAAKQEQSKPRIQLAVSITNAGVKADIKEADALIFPASETADIKSIWGAWISTGKAEDIEKSIKSGADFAVLPSSGETVPADKKIGKILQIESTVTDILLRSANELPVDAVLLKESDKVESALTWNRLLLINRFSGLSSKPLLVEVSANITEAELQQVWEAGVSGVIVTTDSENAEAVAKKLRAAIEKLSFPVKKKQEKSIAILPRVTMKQEELEDDEDDDDD